VIGEISLIRPTTSHHGGGAEDRVGFMIAVLELHSRMVRAA
jgi:hypothetical protein